MTFRFSRMLLAISLLIPPTCAFPTESDQEVLGPKRFTQTPSRFAGGCPSGALRAPARTAGDPCDCHLAPEQNLFADTAAALENEANENPDPSDKVVLGPAKQNGVCGRRTILADTIESGQIEIRTSSGVERLIPLFLSDKTGGFYCVAIRPWTPCLLASKRIGNGIELTLATERSGKRKASVFVPSNFDRRKITSTDDNFQILRRKVDFKSVADGDVITEVKNFAADTKCAQTASTKCRRDRQWATERRMLQIVRMERKPIGAASGEPNADFATFDANVLSKLNTPAQRLIARAIMRNEIGYVPGRRDLTNTPYEILDAGGPSGISFGYFQVDLAKNEGNERAPFRAVLEKLQTADDLALKTVSENKWLEYRVQTFSVDVLLTYFRLVRPFYETARSNAVRGSIDAQLIHYAKGRSGCLGLLAARGPPFGHDPVARVYVLDIANHFGNSLAPDLVRAAEQDPTHPTDAMLDYLKRNTDYGKNEKNHKELQNRIENIRTVVSAMPANDQNAVDHTACKLSSLTAMQ